MIRRSTAARFILLAAFLFVSLAAGTAHAKKKPRIPRGKTWHVDFRADTLGLPPTGSVTLSGDWAVLEDSTATPDAPDSLPRFLRQRSGDDAVSMNWIRFVKPNLERCEVSVRFRIVAGELDPSVGIVFLLNPKRKDGYLVRISGDGGQMVAHYLLGGRRRDIKFQKMDVPKAGEWHTLGVRKEGLTLTAFYDGKETMSLRDERFSKGEVGLWTEDDTVADFADLTITAR